VLYFEPISAEVIGGLADRTVYDRCCLLVLVGQRLKPREHVNERPGN